MYGGSASSSDFLFERPSARGSLNAKEAAAASVSVAAAASVAAASAASATAAAATYAASSLPDASRLAYFDRTSLNGGFGGGFGGAATTRQASVTAGAPKPKPTADADGTVQAVQPSSEASGNEESGQEALTASEPAVAQPSADLRALKSHPAASACSWRTWHMLQRLHEWEQKDASRSGSRNHSRAGSSRSDAPQTLQEEAAWESAVAEAEA